MIPILETVPNFSEGRDPGFLREVSAEMGRAGVEILDASADPDHHRSVVTAVGHPTQVENALVAAALVARERIDLRTHRGVHPRIGALDVAPVVPLLGAEMSKAATSAGRVADRIAELGIPVYLYGRSGPGGRTLADLRRGGFEQLADGFPAERPPDRDAGRSAAHPTAGVTCVGARPLLLAWNLLVEGVHLDELRRIASALRETGGGYTGLRALALSLPGRREHQLSMNLEDVERRDPYAVFEAAERAVDGAGGSVVATEVIGMIPDALVLRTSARRLGLLGADAGRLLSARVARHAARRGSREFETLVSWVRAAGSGVPSDVREAAERLALESTTTPILGDSA
jgi:glutamate formiminotransferase